MRLFAMIACFLAAAMIPGASLAQARAPIATERIVAIGDLHGDHQAWTAILRAARLIDPRGRWAGGQTILVQTGDIVDRGPDSRLIIEDMMRLSREAQRAGGRLVVLIGNHEAMVVTGDLRYVHPGEYTAFATRSSAALREQVFQANRPAIEATYRARSPDMTAEDIKSAWLSTMPLGKVEHQREWAPGGRLGRWTIANPAAVKIGGTLFVHGGLSQAYAAIPLDEINRRAREALQARAQEASAIINDPLGPLWYRGMVMALADGERPATGATNIRLPPAARSEQEVEAALAAHSVRRIVVGHTPSVRGIRFLYGGKLIQIDTGISRAYGGVPTYLEILGERVAPHEVKRP